MNFPGGCPILVQGEIFFTKSPIANSNSRIEQIQKLKFKTSSEKNLN